MTNLNNYYKILAYKRFSINIISTPLPHLKRGIFCQVLMGKVSCWCSSRDLYASLPVDITCFEISLSSLSPRKFLWPFHLGHAWLTTKLVNVFSNSHTFWRHCCCQNNWGARVRDAKHPAIPRKFLTTKKKLHCRNVCNASHYKECFNCRNFKKSYGGATERKDFSVTPYYGPCSALI